MGCSCTLGIEVGHGLGQRGHFGLAHAGGGVGNLALQVGQIDGIVIHHCDLAHAAGGQVQGGGGTQPTGPQNQHPGGADALLPFNADLIEQNVARIAQKLVVIHKSIVVGVDKQRVSDRKPSETLYF
jgi:hypothetical protein